MKKCKLILFGILIVATLSCRFFTPEVKAGDESIYENDAFSITYPAGWGMGLFGGEYYDLGVEKIVEICDNPLTFRAKTFFTVATSPLDAGTDLETRFKQTYGKFEDLWGTYYTDVRKQAFEHDTLSGLEIYYSYPYGEAWYDFHDIWLEKDGLIYVLSFRTNSGELENYTGVFDQLLDGFRFKE